MGRVLGGREVADRMVGQVFRMSPQMKGKCERHPLWTTLEARATQAGSVAEQLPRARCGPAAISPGFMHLRVSSQPGTGVHWFSQTHQAIGR